MRRFCLCPTSGMRDMDRSISAVIGGDVTLPCRAEGYMPFKVVEWSRPGANLEYVLILRNKNLDPKIPKPGYKGRVELKDLQNGDVSLVLRNVTSEDSGTYECYVLKSTVRRKRAIKPISTITLNVLPLGESLDQNLPGSSPSVCQGQLRLP
uniref:Ig-like domain-containing protein n=1 Tax=Cyprinodon variegatus TaxID=28743 RepID=A0A3Q2D7R8_CYPVA